MNYEASYAGRPKLLQAGASDLPRPVANADCRRDASVDCWDVALSLGVAAATAAPERPPQQHDVQAWRPLGCPRPA